MPRPISNIIGHRFNRLTVLEILNQPGQTKYLCLCDCGVSTVVWRSNLIRGHTSSCGCLHRDSAVSRHITHGLNGTYIGAAWSCMVQRCFNANNPSFKYYGARGIKPCEFIRASPLHIILTIGHRSSQEFTLDRINNSLGYTCGQCPECLEHSWPMNMRWATRTTQARNTRRSRLISIDGVTKCLKDWADEMGIWPAQLRKLIAKGRIGVIEHRPDLQ